MSAGLNDAAILLLSFDNVRLFGLDGLILFATAAVVGLTWRTVRQAPVDAVALPGSEATVSAHARRSLPAGVQRTGLWATPNRVTSFATLLLGVLMVWAGVRLLAQPDAVRMGMFFAILGLAVVGWLDWHAARAAPEAGVPDLDATTEDEAKMPFWDVVLPRAGGNLRWLLAGAPILCTLLVWRMNRARPLGDDHTDITVLWLVAIAASIVAVAWPIKRPNIALRAWFAAERGWLAIVAATVALAGVLRLYKPTSYPWAFSGDEGQFGWEARHVLEGTLQNPFGTGFFSHPNLFFFLQAWSLKIFGNDVAGLRILSGLMGIAAVLVVMFYARHLFGAIEGALAGLLLATLHHHIFLSRTALNNIGDALFMPLSLWLLDRGVFGKRRMDSLLAGMALGGSQYFYFGSRLLPVIAAAVLAGGVLLRRDRSVAAITERIREIAPYVALVAFGAIVALTPFLAYYIDHSEVANGRMNSVSVFSSGWLDGEVARTGQSAASILLHRMWDCLILPFHGPVHGFYRPTAPYIGVVLAVPFALGLGVIGCAFWRRRYTALGIAYVAACASLAMTEGNLYQTNRYSGAVALFALIGAVGFGALIRILVRLVRIDRQIVLAATAGAVALIGIWNVEVFFRDDNQVELYSDHNTQVANTLAYELKDMEPGVTVYFAGPPAMWYDGFANINFIAPEVVGISLDEPWDPAGPPPGSAGTTLFIFLPERIGELATIQGWFPSGEFNEVHGYDDVLLYYEYRVEPGASVGEDGVYGN
jgi:4-amino-4-deoxy-L-arabinose transferase-like glycosyltransferase